MQVTHSPRDRERGVTSPERSTDKCVKSLRKARQIIDEVIKWRVDAIVKGIHVRVDARNGRGKKASKARERSWD